MEVIENDSEYKIYNISTSRAAPNFLSKTKKKSLRKNSEYQRRLQLLQDFNFPTAAQKIQISKDGQYLGVIGHYPPQVKMFDLSQLSQKFERHLDSEILDFEILSDDYSKLVFLRNDRNIEIHSQSGRYHTLRVPRFGRDMTYQESTCNIMVCGISPEVYRLNLEQGQFLQPFQTKLPAINVCDTNPVHDLLAFGGENTEVECWDPRARKSVGNIDVEASISSMLEELSISDVSPEISCIKFDKDGITMGVGTSTGQCLIYDLRMSKPLIVKDHQYGYPVHNIAYIEKEIISTDKKILKIWDKQSGKVQVNIETPSFINDVCLVPRSGLFIFACEQSRLLSYFLPKLGPAPSWCSFLDNLTEELEETKQSLYESYKFVTKEELESLGLTKLIGTEHLKAYMHGYFMDFKYYSKLRAIAEPFEYEKYKQEKIQAKLAQQAASRISVRKRAPKVNAKTAARILISQEEKKGQSNLLEDPRFKDMFINKDFEVDETDDKFKFYHTNEKKITNDDIEDLFEPVSEEEENENDFFSSEEDEEMIETQVATSKPQKKVTLYEIKKGHELGKKSVSESEKNLPLSMRIQNLTKTSNDLHSSNVIGATQQTFVEKEKKVVPKETTEQFKTRIAKKRGIRELNLPKINLNGRPSFKRRK